jgi:hypothetical protein
LGCDDEVASELDHDQSGAGRDQRRENFRIFSGSSLDSFPHHHPQLFIDVWLMVSNHLQHRIESSSAPLPEHPGEWM